MSATLTINKISKVKYSLRLLLSVVAILGSTQIFANDGLKSINPNTSSVTNGSSSGAASATSSAGGSATYNSGIDWSRASGLPWRGINWSANGTIPSSRIPRLSASQLPTNMPPEWANQIASVPSGTHCGSFRILKGKVYTNKCMGHIPNNSCPSGYTRISYNVSNGSYTDLHAYCIKN